MPYKLWMYNTNISHLPRRIFTSYVVGIPTMVASYQGAAIALGGSPYVNRNVNGRVASHKKLNERTRGLPSSSSVWMNGKVAYSA